MRTVTFSKGSVQRLLRKNWKLSWENLEGQCSAGSSFSHGPKDEAGSCVRGAGDHNVQILFTTPEGELLHAVAGHVGPEDLLEELSFALDLWKKVAKVEDAKARRLLIENLQRSAEIADRTHGKDDVFATLRRRRLTSDHRFSRKNALMDARKFDPVKMVGGGQSFFGTSKGGKKKERIGEDGGKMPKLREL